MTRFALRPRAVLILLIVTGAALALAACGSSKTTVSKTSQSDATATPPTAPTSTLVATSSALAATTVPAGNWPTFDDNAQRSGVGPADTGITAANLHSLKEHTVQLDGTVDSSVIEVAGVKIAGHTRDVIVFTTSYGRTEALDASSGRRLWEFAPASVAKLQGSPQITTAAPVLDPAGEYVYAASPDGDIHKLSLSTGHQIWSTPVTHDPSHEKIAGGLNFDGSELVVATDGYDGDVPPYVGHVVTINPANGRVTHVFNSLCSNITTIMSNPAVCHQSDSAIWGRPGSVIEPDGNILVATSNGDFDGHTNWGDSVLELSPSLKLLHNWTPTDQQALNTGDQDLGSTEPALLPVRGNRHFAVQGGKDGILRLLNLNKLDGTSGPAGPRTGGELQDINAPGPTDVYSQPAVWQSLMFVADGAGTAAYRYGSDNRLHLAWQNGTPGTSPIVAGGLLYVYNEDGGSLDVYSPVSGHLDATLAAAAGHWNSPTVIGGHIFLPVGDDNAHLSTGQLYMWTAPAH